MMHLVKTSDPILRATNLRKVYPGGLGKADSVAVQAVSFELSAGGSLAIVGESGSGKTTVAKMLVGLERPTAGLIEVFGRDRTLPARRAKDRRLRGREIQIVFQDPYTSLDRRQRVGDGIAAVHRLHFGSSKTDAGDQVNRLAAMVGLDERQIMSFPGNLSGGQRQRVAIARALAAEPKILILDESVAALDVSIQAQVLNLLADIRDETGISYVVISHDLAVIRQVTENAVVMRRGEIVESGSTAGVLDNPQHAYTQLLRASVPGSAWSPAQSLDPPPQAHRS